MADKDRVEGILDWFASGDMSCGPATQDIKLISDYINQLEAEVKRLEEESAILKEDLRGIDEATKAAIAFKIKEWKEKCAKVAETLEGEGCRCSSVSACSSCVGRRIAAAIRNLPEGDG